MREELKSIDYRLYGLSERHFDYFLKLIRRLQEAHISQTQQSIAHLRDDPDAVEIVSDTAYYAWIDTVYLWEYALWRMQGILESVITSDFLAANASGQRILSGLKAKLDAMEKAGYSLSRPERHDLLDWAKLRNALSHAPPEPYHPVGLDEADILEYRALVVGLCTRWRAEKQSNEAQQE